MKSCSTLFLLLLNTSLFAQPASFLSCGIGGGGALFCPSVNPADGAEMYFASDLGGLYHTSSAGAAYDVVHFTEAVTGPFGKVCFTTDNTIRYSLLYDEDNFVTRPAKSTDGGAHWDFLPGDDQPWEDKLFIYADYEHPGRVYWTDYNHLYFSSDGGQIGSLVWTAADFGAGILLSGAYFNGNDVWLGTNEGILVSHNSGVSFTNAGFSGIPAGEVIIGFGGAKNGNLTRFFALTGDPGNVWASTMGYNYWQTIRNVYRMDNLAGAWTPASTGINISQDYAVYLAMADNDPNTCYIAGSTPNEEAIVMKTADGGNSWQHTYLRANNQNIYTGYQGAGGDLGFSWGGNALGFTVNPHNSQHAVLTDYGFIHQTLDGGATWHQAYTSPADENPPGASTPKKKYYHGVGMEQTTVWQVYWFDADQMFACFTDIRGIRSADGGNAWSFDYSGHSLNTMYRIAKHNTDNIWFAATSSVHDIYQTTYITDQRLQPSYKDGYVLYSTNKGKDWLSMRDFDNPVVWVTTDPSNNERLYAAVVSTNPAVGGIWRADGISNPATATWTKLPNPPANNGRIFNIHALNDGTLLSTWSARKSNSGNTFSDSSGVFVSSNGGQNWQRRNDPSMNYWTKDLVIDPADPTQNTWYVCVWSGWGGPANDLGRLLRSTDRGLHWQAITTPGQFHRVSSVSVDPLQPETMYLTTEGQGLWVTHNKSAAAPTWTLVDAYPFQHTERVFFNPYNPAEMWVASFGNGMRKGTTTSGTLHAHEQLSYFEIVENPASDGIRVALNLPAAGMVQFRLLNMAGQCVQEFPPIECPEGRQVLSSPLRALPAGVYALELRVQGRVAEMRKVVVE